MAYRTILPLMIAMLTCSSVYPEEKAMTLDGFERELTAALTDSSVDAFMRLVAPDIVIMDGSDYEVVKGKMGQMFTQFAPVRVGDVEREPLEDGQVEVKVGLELNVPGQDAPYPLALYFAVEKRGEGYRIVDIYDDSERRMKDNPLYDPGFNRTGLPAEVLELTDQRTGVWAGEDMEIVRTRKVEIRFWRDPGSATGVWAQFSLLRYTGEGLEQHVRALVYADSETRAHRVHALYLGDFSAGEPLMSDAELTGRVVTRMWTLGDAKGDALVLVSADGESERVWPDGRIEIRGAGGNRQRLERVEEIEVLPEMPEMPTPGEDGIGSCLRAWQLGVSAVSTGAGAGRMLVITDRHDFIFEVREDFCYCRSSRYEVCDKGKVGQQDVRLMVNPNEFTARMPGDLTQRLRQRVAYDEALFDPTICVFAGDSNYWSVKSVSDELIELHGCEGAVYPYYRPQTAQSHIEWFR